MPRALHSLIRTGPKVHEFAPPDSEPIHLRPFTVGQMEKFLAARDGSPSNVLVLFPLAVSFSVCQPNGDYVFAEKDIDEIRALDFVVVKAIAMEALRISGLGLDHDDPEKN